MDFKLVCVLISWVFRNGLILSPMAKFLAPGGLKIDQMVGSSYLLNYFSWLHVVHYNDITMGMMVSLLTGVSIVFSNICSGAVQRKHQSSASLAFMRGIHRSPVNSLQKRASNAENISIWWFHYVYMASNSCIWCLMFSITGDSDHHLIPSSTRYFHSKR